MALILPHLELAMQVKNRVTARESAAPRVLSLGYPDALITEEALAKLLGEAAFSRLRWREDAQAILRWHGMEGALPRVADTCSLFAAMGMEIEYVDISPSRGVEQQADLNHPLPERFHGQYDLVVDLGTLEHCFNVGQAMSNVLQALKPGGYALHSNPFGHYNHGFFNFSPTLYQDFYGQNGGEIVFMQGLMGTPLSFQLFTPDDRFRSQPLPVRSILLVLAQRTRVQETVWPMQGKYRANPGLKG